MSCVFRSSIYRQFSARRTLRETWRCASQNFPGAPSWHSYSLDDTDVGYPNWVRSFRTVNSPPTWASPASPPDGSVQPTLTPSLTLNASADPDGDTVYHYIRVSENPDALTGAVNDSGWLVAPNLTWTIPAGALVDGKKYYWTALAIDPWATYTTGWSTPRSFRVDLGLGNKASRPYDELGPVSVNLANGNLLATVSSPTVNALGGPIGLSYSYNSQAPAASGLKGDYYRDDPAHNFTGERILTRLDQNVYFNWGQGAPNAAMNPDNFSVRWTGYMTAPAAGTYKFGRISDDGVKIWVNNALVVDSWVDQSPTASPIWGGSLSLAAGQSVAVKIEYFEHFVNSTMQFWVEGPIGAAGALGSSLVPGAWLTADLPGLPGGWTMSADPDGDLSYTHARIGDQQVVLTDSSGATHTYNNTGSAWQPPEGEDGILAFDSATGLMVLQAEDALVYNFSKEGQLASVVSALDDRRPAAPQYTYGGTPVRLTEITDPVSGRGISLVYQSPGGSACPSSAGYTSPPSYMLCKVDYSEFGAGETKLFYSAGNLARIEDPGSETIDFGYDASGKLSEIRDPLTNDLIATGQITDPTASTHKSIVAYSANKVSKITAAVPDAAGSPRPERTYTYQGAVTKVAVAGTSPAVGYARQVTSDSGGRMVEDKDSAGKATTFQWDQQDRLVSTADPAGLKSTTLYDAAGRPTDTYGPAASSEFTSDNRSGTAPHTVTAYDEGIDGLSAAWWENSSIAGPPKAHTHLQPWADWGSGSVASTVPADGFSGRLTGEVIAPTAGSYNFAAEVATDDGVRLYVDDKVVIDRWDTYRQAVSKDAPIAYWRLGDSSGAVAEDATANNRDATYQNGVVLAEPAVIEGDANSAVRLDGVNDFVVSPSLSSAFTTNDSITAELWFKAEAAGVILTEQGSPTPNSGWYDSQLEILPSGEMKARVWNVPPISLGTASFNQWQHVALRYDKASQVLDGFLNGARSAQYSTGDRLTPPEYGFAQHYALGAADVTNKMGTGAWFKGAIDEAAVYNKPLSDSRIQDHFRAAKLQGTASLTAGSHRIRIDYQDPGGSAKLAFNWTPPGGTSSQIPAASLKPRYGLVTSETDADGKKTATEYVNPELGLPTATSVDPAGLNLRSTTTYEPPGSGYFRATARTLPEGAATRVTYAHFAQNETADNPCTTATEATDQGGLMKSDTAADPDAAGPKQPIVREYRYDSQGRTVAERVAGDPAWSCITYDSRGRVVSRKDSSGKTTSIDYSIPAKVTTAYKDSSGDDRTTVSKIDWLGRDVTYTDENATVTRNAHDQAGRVTATYRSLFGGPELQLTSLAYDAATTRLASMTEFASGAGRTTAFSYDDAGRLKTTSRPNGVATTNGYDAARGWLTSTSNKKDSTELSPWTYTRSASGDIASEATTGRTRNFTYDAAGRLTRAVEGAVTRNYSYDKNTNRCSTAISCDGGYLYDNADRITASPFATAYSYDDHGNMTSATLTKPASDFSSTFPKSVPANDTVTEPVRATAAGTITATVDWNQTQASKQADSTVAALGQKDHGFSASANGAITANLSWPSQTVNPNLDLYLLDSAGNEVASSKALTGNSESVTFNVAGIGAYPDSRAFTLRVKAVGLGSDYSLSYQFPATADIDLELLNPSGTKVAEATSTSAKPETLAFSIAAGATGDYSLKVISKDHAADTTVSVSYPRKPEMKIFYDANDHATQIDDGTHLVKETLSPTGRVLRRVVTDPAGRNAEDTTFDYDDSGDSPAHQRPTPGGPLTTYITGPEGLLVTDASGTPTYPLTNAHGDISGNTDASGVLTPVAMTDEFGVGPTPDSRLGWLGSKQRYSTGGELGLIRMGVRLYDPRLGRFLQVDPVEGGSANDYEYCGGDSANCLDLDGQIAMVLVPVGIGAFKAAMWTAAFATGAYGAWRAGLAQGGIAQGWREIGTRTVDGFQRIGAFFARKIGPSGKPAIHNRQYNSKRAAREGAARGGKGRPIRHSTPRDRRGPHYHSGDKKGRVVKDGVHHRFPRR